MFKIIIKLALVLILFLCLADMPYGYFELVRFLALVSFGYLTFAAKQKNNNTQVIIYVALALLFQPFLKSL